MSDTFRRVPELPRHSSMQLDVTLNLDELISNLYPNEEARNGNT